MSGPSARNDETECLADVPAERARLVALLGRLAGRIEAAPAEQLVEALPTIVLPAGGPAQAVDGLLGTNRGWSERLFDYQAGNPLKARWPYRAPPRRRIDSPLPRPTSGATSPLG